MLLNQRVKTKEYIENFSNYKSPILSKRHYKYYHGEKEDSEEFIKHEYKEWRELCGRDGE